MIVVRGLTEVYASRMQCECVCQLLFSLPDTGTALSSILLAASSVSSVLDFIQDCDHLGFSDIPHISPDFCFLHLPSLFLPLSSSSSIPPNLHPETRPPWTFRSSSPKTPLFLLTNSIHSLRPRPPPQPPPLYIRQWVGEDR